MAAQTLLYSRAMTATLATLADVKALLDGWYDPSWAESWDAVGLVCGDPEQPVRKVLFAVDPAPVVVAEAIEWGADLVVCHHPLLLTPVHGVAATTPKGRVVHDLLRAGTALLTAHTNADVPADGVNESLARAVGILDPQVVVSTDDDALDKLVTFVPHEHADAVRSAITAAGAGCDRRLRQLHVHDPGGGALPPARRRDPRDRVGRRDRGRRRGAHRVGDAAPPPRAGGGRHAGGAPLRGGRVRRPGAGVGPRGPAGVARARPDRPAGGADDAARVRRPGRRRAARDRARRPGGR